MSIDSAATMERLISQRRITDAGCWEFTGYCYPSGYGELCVDGKPWRVHRLMFTIEKGPIPDGLHVLHSCDNPPCFNPDHLRAGTQKENMQDSIARGRNAMSNGKKTWDSRGSAVPWECINGHDMRDPANVYVTPRGYRECRPCRTERSRIHANRLKAAREARCSENSGLEKP